MIQKAISHLTERSSCVLAESVLSFEVVVVYLILEVVVVYLILEVVVVYLILEVVVVYLILFPLIS